VAAQTSSTHNPPYWPFLSQHDFEYAKEVIEGHESDQKVNRYLKNAHGPRFNGCNIVARNAQELKEQLDCAAGISDKVSSVLHP
jgi:hypothetical protein